MICFVLNSVNGQEACILRNSTLPRQSEVYITDSFTKKFYKPSTRQISIDESSCVAVPFGLRTVFPNLQVLNITRSGLKIVARKLIANFTQFDFSRNKLRGLPVDAFWDCPELTDLNLSFNYISNLDENLLIYSPELKEFNADSNIIERLHRDLFLGNQKLQKISFAENALVHIGVDFFNSASFIYVNLLENNCIDVIIDKEKEDSFAKLKIQQKIVLSCTLELFRYI